MIAMEFTWLIGIQSSSAIILSILSGLLLFFRQIYKTPSREKKDPSIKKVNNNTIAVVIPARNEEEAIGETLSSLLKQNSVTEIIVVDDESTDKTAEVVRGIMDDDTRVRLLYAPNLPEDWVGKTHAIHWAAQHSKAEYILFTDADVTFHGSIISDLETVASQDKLDHVGGYFGMELNNAWEAILGPVLASVAFVSLGLSALKYGAGTGAFNMIRRDAYILIKGHYLIRNNLVDDVAFARLVRKCCLKSRFFDLSDSVKVRLFAGMRGYCNAVARSAIPFLGKSSILAILLLVICSFLVAPFVMAPFVIAASLWQIVFLGDSSTALMTGMVSIFVYLIGAIPFIMGGWLHNRSRYWGFFYPVGLLAMFGSVFFAAVRDMAGLDVEWRGRRYQSSHRKDA